MAEVGPGGLVVLATGPFASVQDLGRPGSARFGVSPSGAADRVALALANRLVGNPPEAAGIEVTLGGLSVRAGQGCLIALAGADAGAAVDGRAAGTNATTVLPGGATLTLGIAAAGLRTYVAVRGGIDVPAVLGSRSYDVLAQLGPPPLQAGDRLRIGVSEQGVPDTDWAPPTLPGAGVVALRCRPGPRADWFTPAARRVLTSAQWTVTTDADRIGVRLAGPRLDRLITGELPSEGLVRGAIQVPASGQPLIFLADHPTTGGYPVIAVIDNADTDRVAQLRPGQTVVCVGDERGAVGGLTRRTRYLPDRA